MDTIGFVLSIIFGLFWAYVCWLTVVAPPTEDPVELSFLAFVLSAGVIVVARALLYGA